MLWLLACHEVPTALLICHNSNCVEPVDTDRDDTVEALEQSLALTRYGRPVIDGVEIDLFWRRQGAECLFAHDLDDLDVTSPASVPASIIADHLRAPGDISWSGQRFTVFVELKPAVDRSGAQRHSAPERVSHAECALDAFDQIAAGAGDGARQVEVIFTSFEPRLLAALYQHPRWPRTGETVARLGLVRGIPRPLDNQTPSLADLTLDLPVTMVETHPDWTRDAEYDAFESAGWEVGMWMFTATAEILDSIERHEPDYVVTGEARLLRGWLAR
ncbi:MAG: hypothetical protein KJO07_22150 [Deltaproteobacteria bacterium]|nr:hypothetical protein [Deltaproteobacteria bacterium]